MMTLVNLACLLSGGALGTLLRYNITETLLVSANMQFNVILVNVIGSFLMGVFFVCARKYALGERYTLFFAVGLLEAFTAMILWVLESVNLWLEHKWLAGATNIFLNVFLSLAAVWLGLVLTAYVLRSVKNKPIHKEKI